MDKIINETESFAMGYDHEGGHRYGWDVTYQREDGSRYTRREVVNDAGEEWTAAEWEEE